jgi:peptidoglycan biosynthesis protein MviN/MurJ (putative lipid II flippase)
MSRFRSFIEKFWHSPTRWVMVITFTGMAFGLIFHVLIPRRFNVGPTADALIAALKVVLLVDTIVREGAKFSLVPLFIKEEKLKNSTEYQYFINGILNFSLGVGVVIALTITAFAPWIATGLLSNSSTETRAEMTILLRLCAPLIIFGCGSTILGAFSTVRNVSKPWHFEMPYRQE